MRIINLESVSSTQKYAIELILKGKITENTLIITKKQTEGVGRLGEKWLDGEGNLMMSCVLINPNSDESCDYSIECGKITAFLIEKATNIKIDIKYPNDLMINGKKLGGIITNIENINGIKYIVFGIGVNIANHPENINPLYEATSLFHEEMGIIHAKTLGNAIFEALINRFF